MLIPGTLVWAMLPARSVTVPVTLWPAPSPNVVDGEQVATPESASLQVKLTVTLSLYQLLALGARSGAPLIVGAVWSILMPLTVVLALLPARSVTVPVALWLAPSWV